MNISIVAIISVLIVITALIILRMKRHANRINDYFVDAVTVWVFLNKEDAKAAALTAAKVAAGMQRNSMVTYLYGMATDIDKIKTPDVDEKIFIDKLTNLAKEIGVRDWTIKDSIEEKQRLFECNPKYLEALEKADPSIFSKEYPDLFKKLKGVI